MQSNLHRPFSSRDFSSLRRSFPLKKIENGAVFGTALPLSPPRDCPRLPRKISSLSLSLSLSLGAATFFSLSFKWLLSAENMDPNVDHYCVLGLPSGEEGAKLTEKEISKAYKLKALELHPDKRPDDPNAHANFQMLKSSYEILKDEKARKLFDDLLRVKREQQVRRSQQGAKRQKMVNDLEERERAAFAPDPAAKAREEEERISRKLKEEIARIIAMRAKKAAPATPASKREIVGVAKEKIADSEREKMLKVSWEKVGEDYYTAKSLRELFSKFGGVEDVVIKSSKKKGSALVVMATKDAAVAATGNVSGNLSNPLLVLPLQPSPAAEFSGVQHSSESDHLDHLVGPSYKAYEDSILEKVLKAAAAQKKK